MTQISAKRPKPPHAAQVAENSEVLGAVPVEQRDGPIQQRIIAAGDHQDIPVGRIRWRKFRIIEGAVFDPLLHEVLWKKPLPGHLGGR